MTWLSRLLPQSPSLQRLANHNNRTRQAQRRRRMATLESLEGRTLLSGGGTVTVLPVAGGVLNIYADTHTDNFSITENGGGVVTVVGGPVTSPVTTHTSINTAVGAPAMPLGQAIVKHNVVNINVYFAGPTSNTVDVVDLVGQGKTTPTGIKNVSFQVTSGVPKVTITAENVDNSGTFTVNDPAPLVAIGSLSTTVSNSTFASLAINQTGCCSAYVELDNDNIPATVTVTEGVGNGDKIVLDKYPTSGDTFGSTTLIQGAGPAMQGCDGSNDYVYVDDASLKDLTIHQLGDGDKMKIEVGKASEVEVALTSFGLIATQGSGGFGERDTIDIRSITTTPPNTAPNKYPAGSPDNISTSQSNGDHAETYVDGSTVYGTITSTQGDGNRDIVKYTGDQAGQSAPPIQYNPPGHPAAIPETTVSITQGNGDNDQAILDCGVHENVGNPNLFDNVTIQQGDAIQTPDCDPTWGDKVIVNCTDVASDLLISQGINGTSIGNNVVLIANKDAVIVGSQTVINEIGPTNGDNDIELGGFNPPNNASVPGQKPDFDTGWLDIYAGANGGSYVQVNNTLAENGAFGVFSPYSINGDGGSNNASLDAYSSLTVLINPNF